MANVKISELPAATSVDAPDSFVFVQGGVTKQSAKSVLFASPTFTGTAAAAILTASGDVTFDGGAFVFNESGADKDARFEGDTDANLLFLDASTDRVGIGTGTPQAKLDIAGANATQRFRVDESTSGYTYTQGLDDTGVYFTHNSSGRSIRWAPNAVTQMELSVSGNLGVGTTPSTSTKIFGLSGNDQHGVYGQAQGTGNAYYGVLGITTKSAAISSGGTIGISRDGTTFGILGYFDTSNNWGGYFNGNVYTTGSYQPSDARLKENVQTLSGSLQIITALRPVEFDWRPDSSQGKAGKGHDVGLIAQEVLPVLPELVKEIAGASPLQDAEPSLNAQLGTFYTLDYARLVPHLIGAIQEQQALITALTARVAALEAG